VARRCSRNLPGSYADSIGLGCHGHADCDEFEELEWGIVIRDGSPASALPDVTVTERRADTHPFTYNLAEIERAIAAEHRISPEEVSRAFRGLTNATSRGTVVTQDASASFRGIDRSVGPRPLQWSTQQQQPITVADILRSGEELRRIGSSHDQVDALEYAWRHVWGRRETQSTVGRVQSFPPGQYEASMAAPHAVRGMLAIASAGVTAVAAARRLAEREVGWRALTALGTVGRGVTLALESNYGSTLRGALLEIGRSVAVPVADLTPTRGALLEFR
jgi:hypothetical protein